MLKIELCGRKNIHPSQHDVVQSQWRNTDDKAQSKSNGEWSRNKNITREEKEYNNNNKKWNNKNRRENMRDEMLPEQETKCV